MTTMAPRQRPPLDRWRFDELAAGAEKIWGLEALSLIHISEPTRPY